MLPQGVVINGLEFASRQGKLAGRLRLDTLPRLTGMLFEASGHLDYEVAGETAGEAAFLALKLNGTLPLTCQRCLGALDYALSVRNRVMLVGSGSPWPEDDQVGGLEDEACDAIEGSRDLDLVPLLEEEILLALPIAPRHEHCDPPRATAIARELSPFAQLAKLKRNQ